MRVPHPPGGDESATIGVDQTKTNGQICGALFLLVSLAGSAANAAAPFAKGETIRYAIKKMGIKVGEATLAFEGETQRDGKTYALIIFTAKGFNFFDEERIFVDGDTFLPQLVLRDLDVFGKKATVTEAYDQVAGTVTITKVAKGKTTVRTLAKTGPIDNIYGFIFRYRLHGGFGLEERVNVALPAMDVAIAGVKNLKFKAAGQTYPVLLLQSVPAQYSIWMDRGPAHLPLRIAGAVGFAKTVMTMIEYKP